VRVIRAADPRAPAPRATSFVPSARRMDAARYEARLEAERTIADARAEAERIREEARTRGREEGRAEVLALLVRAQAEAHAVAERATDLVVTATRAVAERALGQALQGDAPLAAWTREALATLAGARRIVLHASPATIARLSSSELGPIALEEASDLPEGTLLARSELGEVSVELRTQVDAFVAAIADVLAKEVRARV
jgi:hypothetical protein